MKAVAVFPAQRALRVIDVAEPGALEPGEVRVRTLEVGICGTDKEIASFQYGTPPPESDHLILGHECLGEIVEVGPAAHGLARGDLVVPRVRRPCPHARCTPCRGGRSDYCVTGDYTERGIKGRHGFACERWVEHVQYLHRLPRELRAIGVLTEPLTIAEKALEVRRLVQARLPGARNGQGTEQAIVIGSGPVGLLGAMALMEAGFKTYVYARSRAPSRKASAAQAFGARYLSSQDVAPPALKAEIGDLDFVYEAAGASLTAFDVLNELGPNGVFVFTGVPGRKQPIQLDGAALMKRIVLSNQVAFGTVNAGPEAFEGAISDLARGQARWPGALGALLTHRHTPEQAVAALQHAQDDAIKQVIVFA